MSITDHPQTAGKMRALIASSKMFYVADSQDKQKKQTDAKGRRCIESYEVGERVVLNAKNLPTNVAPDVFKTKLTP